MELTPRSLAARLFLGLSSRGTSFERRGFAAAPEAVRQRLEAPFTAFLEGVAAAIVEGDDRALCRRLRQSYDAHLVGFAFEGAGAERAARDLLRPGPGRRLDELTHGAAADHDYIATVGAGLALARLPWGSRRLGRYMAARDPLLAWCVADGVGFHHGIFGRRAWVEGRAAPPKNYPTFVRQLFDAGLGRSLWWVEAASPVGIRRRIDRFAAERRPELWFGVGLAASYAGGVGAETLGALLEAAGPQRAHLRAGVPFACRLRQKAANSSTATELAARVLLGTDADSAASLLAGLLEATLAETAGDEATVRTGGFRRLRRRITETVAAGLTVPAELSFEGSR